MLPHELEEYLRVHIPLSRAMEAAVVSIADESVVLSAPLRPNINHRETVFGGSASALGILAAWSLLHLRLQAAGVTSRLVIQRNTMEYLEPITGAFTARALLVEPERWQQFLDALTRKGKSRIAVTAVLEHRDRLVGRLSGDFVALNAEKQD